MVRIQSQQPEPLIQNRYSSVLDRVMAEHNIPSPQERPDHRVSANANFRMVVRYTGLVSPSWRHPTLSLPSLPGR